MSRSDTRVAGDLRPDTGGIPRLEVESLSKTFGGVTVLDNAHLTLMPGEIHGLVGQNGSGKSTLIKLISGVHKADPGGTGPRRRRAHRPPDPSRAAAPRRPVVRASGPRPRQRSLGPRERPRRPARDAHLGALDRQAPRPRGLPRDVRLPQGRHRPRRPDRVPGPEPARRGRGGPRPAGAGARQGRHRLRRVLPRHPARGAAGVLRHGAAARLRGHVRPHGQSQPARGARHLRPGDRAAQRHRRRERAADGGAHRGRPDPARPRAGRTTSRT